MKKTSKKDVLVRLFLPYSMLNEYESPILKKSCFVKNDYRYTNTNEVLKACEYIKERTKFDENIIWDYLLENFDIADIIDMLHLNYVLSGERNLLPTYQNKKCAIIMHITYLNAIEESVNYIKNLPEEICSASSPKYSAVKYFKSGFLS